MVVVENHTSKGYGNAGLVRQEILQSAWGSAFGPNQENMNLN